LAIEPNLCCAAIRKEPSARSMVPSLWSLNAPRASVPRPSLPEEARLTILRIHHRTTYRYSQPVAFGTHRLMLRPRESRDLRLLAFEVVVTPAAEVTWAHDVWGNAVATADFQAMDDTMTID